MTSAPGKGLDKVRSAAHKMHLGNHSNEPCQLLLRVSPQGVCTTQSFWAQFSVRGPGVPPHSSLGCDLLLLCLAGHIALWVPTSCVLQSIIILPSVAVLDPVLCLVRCSLATFA